MALKLVYKEAVQSVTDYGIKGIGGPCPTEGHGFTIIFLQYTVLKQIY